MRSHRKRGLVKEPALASARNLPFRARKMYPDLESVEKIDAKLLRGFENLATIELRDQ